MDESGLFMEILVYLFKWNDTSSGKEEDHLL